MDEDDYKDKTREQLIAELEEAYHSIVELEDENQSLNSQLETANRNGGKRSKKSGKDVDDALQIAELQQEIEGLISEKERNAVEIAALQEKLSESVAVQKTLQQQKTEAEVQTRDYLKKIQSLEADMEKLSLLSRTMEQQSKEATKLKTAGVKETQRLFDENDQLREENKKLTESLKAHEESVRILETHLLELTDQKEELELAQEKFDLVKEDLQNQIIQLEFHLEQSNEKLQIAQDAENDTLAKMEALKKEVKVKMDTLNEELRGARNEIGQLKKEIVLLKDSTLVGEKQRELDKEKAENRDNIALIDQLRQALESTVSERDQLATRILEDESKVGMLVAERVVEEREHNKILERTLKSVQQRLDDEIDKSNELEQGRQALAAEIDDLLSWKAIYESGHGLQQFAKTMKTLKDDNRVLSMAVNQLTGRVGMLVDANGLISHAFERLKKECGMDPDFNYPEYELQEELASEKATLKSQVSELEEQVNSLEEDCVRLRKALKNQAGVIGEQGFKYAGMTAEQLSKVNEFAMNLKDGTLELPLNDRSHELLKENRQLKDDIKLLRLQIENFERQIGSSVGPGHEQRMQQQQQFELAQTSVHAVNAGLNKKQEAELFGLREDVQRLIHENGELREGMIRMQSELMVLLRSQANKASNDSNGVGGQNDIVNMLLVTNESLMKENQQLKQHMSQQGLGSVSARQQQQQQHQQQKAIDYLEASSGPNSQQFAATADVASIADSSIPQKPPIGRKAPITAHTPVRKGPQFTPVPSEWTPMGMSGVGPNGLFGTGFQATYSAPSTPHGKQMLTRNLSHMNLPPEEWAIEVRDLHGQLVESLEQLVEREQELEEQQQLVAGLEDSLVSIKQQLAVVYYDFAKRADSWETREKQYKTELSALRNAKDDLTLRLTKTESMINVVQNANEAEREAVLLDLHRKVLIMEVNENVLSRKFISLQESLSLEQDARQRLEGDFVEMESTLKKRILYLEQYKAAMSSRLGQLQGRLDKSVPSDDFIFLQQELENLREDHLQALQREVDARIMALKSHDQAAELRTVKLNLIQLQTSLTHAEEGRHQAMEELEHQKILTEKAIANNFEYSATITEMAKFRGEASRMKVELTASQRRVELLTSQIQSMTHENGSLVDRLREIQSREEDARKRESIARKQALESQQQFQGGLNRAESQELQTKFSKLSKELEECQLEVDRQKELAEIASLQVQSIGAFKQQRQDDIKELQEFCAKLESKGDDDLLIGKLQRQLMSTKTSYKAFARKYQALKTEIRQREIALRVLETKLDQREEVSLDVLETHRMEVAALKKALRTVNNTIFDKEEGPKDGKESVVPRKKTTELIPLGKKLASVTEKVRTLAELATKSETKATEAEETSKRLAGIVEDLQTEKDSLLQECRDLQALTKPNPKHNQIAARLVSLSEDVRVNKLAALQQKRQIQVLKSEKTHLQKIIAGMELDVEDLEQGRIMAETKHLLDDEPMAEPEKLEDNNSSKITMLGPNGAYEDTIAAYRLHRGSLLALASSGEKGHGAPQSDSLADGPGQVDELMEKLESATQQLTQARKDESQLRLHLDRCSGRIDELECLVREKEEQLQYCDRVFREEGLPSLAGHASLKKPGMANQSFGILREEQSKLQEAANVTVGSLRELLEEKNKQLERYRERIEELQRERKTKSYADRRADELLESLDHGHRSTDRSKKGIHSEEAALQGQHSKLLTQIEQADELLRDKDRTIAQLEQKLVEQSNRRERAEIRCGATLKEMEVMQADLGTLVAQLKSSEERCALLATAQSKQSTILNDRKAAATPIKVHHSVPEAKEDRLDHNNADAEDEVRRKELQEKKFAAMQKSIQAKDEKIKSYREMIIRLKDEFVKSEEEKAIAMLQHASSFSAAQGGSGITADEAKELKNQIIALRDGLRQAKEDIEKGKKAREKLNQARLAAEEETEKLNSQLSRSEAQAASAQESLMRTRKELEDARRKEVRLRDKLKEYLENESSSDKLKDLKAANELIVSLQREIEVLQAQNSALRIAIESGSHNTVGGNADGASHTGTYPGRDNHSESKHDTAGAFGAAGSRGHTLGEAPGGSSGAQGPMDSYRQQMHARWENEKKLEKRVSVLEKRLQQKIEENEELQAQVQRARETTQSAINTRDEIQKKVTGSAKLAQEARRLTIEDLVAVKEAQERVFELENENARLKRRVEVEIANEMHSLRSNIANLRDREQDLMQQLEESETRRRNAMRSDGPRTMRESEDRFLVEERLKDDIEAARRTKLSLEAALLERDSRAMELRFDVEAKDEEIERLKRRVKELELAYHTATNIVPSTSAAAVGSASSTAAAAAANRRGTSAITGNKSKREEELEGAVESMKRIVEKMRAENDRLKRSGPPEDNARVAELEKKANSEKKKVEKLEVEVKDLQSQLKAAQDGNQKIVQKQQMIAALRKQLKSKDEEVVSLKDMLDKSVLDKEDAEKRSALAENRLQQLQINIQHQAGQQSASKQVSVVQEKEMSSLRKRAAELTTENESLRTELSLLKSSASKSATSSRQAEGAAISSGDQAELKRLRAENEKLRAELSAFDLEFFEDIENLKFAYAECTRKLRMYEASAKR